VLLKSLSSEKLSLKTVKNILTEKQMKNKINKPIKLIGLVLFKKLASIDSFVIFAV
jgi:hypothetical protein